MCQLKHCLWGEAVWEYLSEFKICVTVEWSMPFLSSNPTEMSAYVPQDIQARICTKSLFL